MKITTLINIFLFFNLTVFSQIKEDLIVNGTLTIIENLNYSKNAVRRFIQTIDIDSITKNKLNNNNDSIDLLFYTPIENEIDNFKIVNCSDKNCFKIFNFKLDSTKFFEEKSLNNKHIVYDSIKGYIYRKYKIKGYCKNKILNKDKNYFDLEFFMNLQIYIDKPQKNKIVNLFFIYYLESIEPVRYN